MWFRSFIDSSQSRSSRTPMWHSSRQNARARIVARPIKVELLEDRRMLSFSPAADYPAGNNSWAMVAADFNADGLLDLATANNSGNDIVSVVLGNADGTFQSPQNSGTGARQLSLAVGDFNTDGKLDLVTANDEKVNVLLGNGDGTFQPPAQIDIESFPRSVAVGDFNGDGKLDLGVTSNVYYSGGWGYSGFYGGSYVGRANVLLGTGVGSFSAPSVTSIILGSYYDSVALADFNNDGKLDFATSDQNKGIGVLLGTGTGTLGAPSYFNSGYLARSLAAGDTNGDGKVDLVTANQGSNNVSVLLGTGDGSFGSAQYFAAGAGTDAVALADFNSDGKTDLLVANWGGDTASVLLGAGAATFRPPVSIAVGASPLGVAVGDFNGDGRVDAATSNYFSNNISVLLNDGIWPPLGAPSITIGGVTPVIEGNAGTLGVVFTVSLSAAYGQPITVQYATADSTATAGSDYQAKSGTLTFAPGQTSQAITVLVSGDRIAESNETFSVNLTNPTNAFLAYARSIGTILDDEPTVAIIDSTSVPEGNIGTTSLAFTVTLSAAYDVPVTVDYFTSDLTDDWAYSYTSATAGVDYQAKSGTLTFAPGETSKTITVLISGDRFVGEGSERFLVNLSNPNGARLGTSQALGEILDDEPYLGIGSASVTEGNSGTTPLTFDVTLSAAYDAPVTVSYATFAGSALAGSDFAATSGALTFAPSETSKTITVLVNGDLLTEDDEYFNINLFDAINALGSSSGAGLILDDDTPPAITISDASVIEGNSGTTLMMFSVSLSQSSGNDVWVNYTTANGTARTSDNDYLAKSGTIHFAPGETSKTIEIVVKGDTRKEKNESFTVKLSGAVNAAITDSQGVGTIINDDGATHGGRKFAVASPSAFAVDAVMEDYEIFGLKKRGR